MKRIFLLLISALACTIGMTGCGEENKEPGNVPLTDITTDRADGISLNVRYGEASANVKFYPVPPNATDVKFMLTSADDSVATIRETKLGEAVVTVLKPGATTVTIASGNVTKDIAVTGRSDVTALAEIRLETDSAPAEGTDTTLIFNLPVSKAIKVKASANPRNANTDANDYVTFTWKSSKPTVATVAEDAETTKAVDKTGTITAIAKGEAEITISCGEIKAKRIIVKVD
ncbi:MAG: hypothetical protein LBG47_04035 [Prevotellaceae bacterium]|jgi:uncharacterized protein YjdB|nr:hypothetical protein [Prevotellaceae bacterium]